MTNDNYKQKEITKMKPTKLSPKQEQLKNVLKPIVEGILNEQEKLYILKPGAIIAGRKNKGGYYVTVASKVWKLHDELGRILASGRIENPAALKYLETWSVKD